jgi:hypothetical protein
VSLGRQQRTHRRRGGASHISSASVAIGLRRIALQQRFDDGLFLIIYGLKGTFFGS